MSKLILVTGASGFLASHIIYQLLKKGHRIRATARGKKFIALKALYKPYPSIEIVEVPDIATSQFPDALVGVDVVIHTATPLPACVDENTLYQTAIGGALNVLRQAEIAGIKKFVVTSSMAAIVGDRTIQGVTYKPEHWNPITHKAASGNPVATYSAAKTFSELAVWEWADAHPHVDVTTINPSYLYGPPSPLSLPAEPGDYTSLSTNVLIFRLFNYPGGHLPPSGCIDFRDTARAHVGAALNDNAHLVWGRKRVLVASPHGMVESEVLDMIREKRPELASRLVDSDEAPLSQFDRLDIDFGRIQEVTGMKRSDFYTMEQTFLETVDSLLTVEKHWKEQGVIINIDYPV